MLLCTKRLATCIHSGTGADSKLFAILSYSSTVEIIFTEILKCVNNYQRNTSYGKPNINPNCEQLCSIGLTIK